MKLTPLSGLGTVAMVVGDALRRAGIHAVLTGGAYLAMEAIGFARRGDRYVHRQVRFYVEFPRGPLAIGNDYRIRPVERKTAYARTLILSATDSCRDRLAAFYHWGDRQSLRVAVRIATANKVSLAKIRRWSIDEGAREAFNHFADELNRARARK